MSIKQQEHRYTVSDENIKNCKSPINKKRMHERLNILTSLREQMSSKNKRLNDVAQEQGSPSWLIVLPIKQLGFTLLKDEFWDAVYLRYGFLLKQLPSHSVVQKFMQWNMCYCAKKEDFRL